MNRINREIKQIGKMMPIYCRAHHDTGKDGLCKDCEELLQYAISRLSHCPHGNQKGSCRKCPIHCYRPDRREQMRAVMRYVGPRMPLYHPIASLRHILNEVVSCKP